MTKEIVELVELQCENALHAVLHKMLLHYGFGFTVDSRLRIGRHYTHATKFLRVELKEGDTDLEALIVDSRTDKVFTEQDYTVAEWQWLSSVDKTDTILWRELYIQCQIRPNVMHTISPDQQRRIRRQSLHSLRLPSLTKNL